MGMKGASDAYGPSQGRTKKAYAKPSRDGKPRVNPSPGNLAKTSHESKSCVKGSRSSGS